MRNEQRFSPPAVGGISLLTVFAVLCLTIFALLSLTTVQANGRLSEAAAQATTNYYAADCQAQEILARLRAGEVPEGVKQRGDLYTYVCPISSTQELRVAVQVQGTDYTVLQWQTSPTGVWKTDNSLDLWDGGMF
ncbi:MAG: hypothetical protein MR419_10575 [Clostridiales bacterium]|nr:hypothetical protein [Clostridiales bacterium]MDY4172505.1 hypothetical protein [Evtepia sp.]